MDTFEITAFAAAAAVSALFCALFLRSGKRRTARRAAFKCVPGTASFLSALLLTLHKPAFTAYSALIVAGLLVCTAADAVLEFVFLPGVCCFAAAHLCFICAFWLRGVPGVAGIVCFACVYALFLLIYARVRHLRAHSFPAGAFWGYSSVLAFMLASSLRSGAYAVVGAALFTISDTLLGLRIFGALRHKASGAVVMITYYSALLMLSASVL
ncbi:MAG: lysoplasmalogenase [Clostridia bacterium]|nr:lysoplasmalogenase [Clostridia bacterium]